MARPGVRSALDQILGHDIASTIGRFLRMETAGGLLLLLATCAAMLVKNSPLGDGYAAFLLLDGQVRVGTLNVEKPLFLWVNDGWMAVFFFLIGLEVKREALHGYLRDVRQIALPVVGATGGVLVPALLYLALTWPDAVAMKGWAVPTATDIAFALAVLATLGSRVPASMKLFLMMLAIIDDLLAVVVIAFFYTSGLSMGSLLAAGGTVAVMLVIKSAGVRHYGPYLVLGVILWTCVLKSGVHATLAGVVTALIMPSWQREDGHESIRALVEALHPWAAFGILPMFAFVNAGISFAGMNPSSIFSAVPLGITLGLFVGKPLGVLLFTGTAIGAGWIPMPEGARWIHLAGIGCLCGIGFTMSLFIGGLAFAEGGDGYAKIDRLGIMLGSLLSAIAGYLILRFARLPNSAAADAAAIRQ